MTFSELKKTKDNWQLAAQIFGQFSEEAKGMFLAYKKASDEFTAETHVRPGPYTLGPIKFYASPDWLLDRKS